MEGFPPRRLLVPYDFSPCADSALRLAMQLAGRWNSRLELVHVYDASPGYLLPEGGAPIPESTLIRIEEDIENELRKRVKDCPRASVRVVEGFRRETLAILMDPRKYDLAVMGTHGRTGFGRLILGSTAEAAIHASKIPVLTTHERKTGLWPSRVLVPLNYTDYADRALLYAEAFAASVNAQITALHVTPPGTDHARASYRLEEHLVHVLGIENAKKVRGVIEEGDPSERIVRAAEATLYDMVVMSAHRKPFLESWRLGRTVDRVLRHSVVPVLSVPTAGVREHSLAAAGPVPWPGLGA